MDHLTQRRMAHLAAKWAAWSCAKLSRSQLPFTSCSFTRQHASRRGDVSVDLGKRWTNHSGSETTGRRASPTNLICPRQWAHSIFKRIALARRFLSSKAFIHRLPSEELTFSMHYFSFLFDILGYSIIECKFLRFCLISFEIKQVFEYRSLNIPAHGAA